MRLTYAPVVAANHQVYALQSGVVVENRWVWNDVATRGWIDAGHIVETPDLSGLEGWDPEWSSGRQPGKAFNFIASTYSGTGSVSDLLLALDQSPINPPHSGLDGLSYTETQFFNQIIP